jgi:hypothetical protein
MKNQENVPGAPAEKSILMKPGDADNVDAVLRVIGLITTQEMHFNKLCADFKKMASTWLLATFGGIGFLISSDIDIGIDIYFLIGAVATAGATGIYLLWVVDLLVYQRLLSSAFTWRGRIEAENPWLPQIFDTMVNRIFAKSVGFNLSWFYMLGVLVPAGIALVCFTYATINTLGFPWLVIAVAVFMSLGLCALLRRMHIASIPKEAQLRN